MCVNLNVKSIISLLGKALDKGPYIYEKTASQKMRLLHAVFKTYDYWAFQVLLLVSTSG
jgi:hypothetical protein